MTAAVAPSGSAPAPQRARTGRRWTRRLVRVLVVLLVLHALVLGAAAWYYSGRIGSDALAVHQPGPWPEDLRVAAVDPTAHTLSVTARPGVDGSAALAQLRRADVDGLHWQGGFARSTGAAVAEGAALTRSVTLVEGTWPAVGASIGVHSFAYPQGPRDPRRAVSFPGPQGDLQGFVSPGILAGGSAGPVAGAPSIWAVMVHGKGVEPDEFDRMMPTFAAAGITSLAIHYRGDPQSPPAPGGRYGFGATEWPDLEAAVDYAHAHGATGVVLVGASMGGAIVASYLRHGKGTDLVRAVVLDSPALSLSRTVQWGADQVALPGGIPLPGPITWGAERLATLRYGVDWSATDYLTDPSWDTVPTLVFHGTADLTVPIATSREFAARRSNVSLVEVAGAEHVASWNVDPAAYERRLAAFLAAPALRAGGGAP